MYKIVQKEKLNEHVEKMVVEAPFTARKCEPGQFIILRVEEDGERIPLTIADYDKALGTVTIIYQVVGHSTRILSEKKTGEYILDFAGPLGRPAHFGKYKRVLGIGGGVGTAPLFPQLKKLHEDGVLVDVIVGARSKEHLILEDELNLFCEDVYAATNDGSYGKEGFVTDVFSDLVGEGRVYDLIIAIGPVPMMKAVVNLAKSYDLPINVSLNPIMVDGTGMCGGCRVSIGDEVKFACVDGPDFDGWLVDFDELTYRQQFYKEKEKDHHCRMQEAADEIVR